MLVSQKPVQSVTVMVLIVFTVSRSHAVTEHQLMHDRGRRGSTLPRPARPAVALNPIPGYTPGLSPALNPRPAGYQSGETNHKHKRSVERLMRNLFGSHLMELSDG
uniref:Uncharacterized protein n=1 Tax=Salmo trutta TaxID=8032 RepID=A0A673YIP2_SALTR